MGLNRQSDLSPAGYGAGNMGSMKRFARLPALVSILLFSAASLCAAPASPHADTESARLHSLLDPLMQKAVADHNILAASCSSATTAASSTARPSAGARSNPRASP